jgi:glycosyltransferase involved in cell wall biosynthesis
LIVSARDPVRGANELGALLRRAPSLAFFGKALGEWSQVNALGTPRLADQVESANQVEFANAKVEVDGWLLIRPDCLKGLALRGRRAVLFPDAVPIEFAASYSSERWREANDWSLWQADTEYMLGRADNVITFSRHVAERHVTGIFGTSPARIRIIPHAPSDLGPDAPFVAGDRRRTEDSRRKAATHLRRHAGQRKWEFLSSFPFEEVTYVAVSTRDRPTKNIPLVVEAVERLIRRNYFDVKLVMTTVVGEVDAPGCLLPSALQEADLQLDAISMPKLPKLEHAAFYHCAAVTVHPALFEGGSTAFPFAESVSVGTPCLMARGPHTDELLETVPELTPWVFNPYDADALAKLIRATILERDWVLMQQLACFSRMRKRTWAHVAAEYADAVVDVPGQSC